MNLLLIAPILVPFATAIVLLLLRRRLPAQRVVSATGAAVLLVTALALLRSIWSAGVQATQIGNWPAPFGITVVADLFSALLVAVTALMGLTVACYSLGSIDREREAFGYYPLLHILLMGVCGAFLTGDIFNLYVWFEVMLMASFVLLELGGEKAQLEGAIKYVTLNLLSSALFLTAVAMLYGLVGTLNMADLAVHLKTVDRPGILTTMAMLFLLAFGIKAAVFPLYFWLPASYHTPPAPVTAIFAGLLTKVGVYSLIRVFTLLFVHDTARTHELILMLAGFTMVLGVLGAVVQNEFRRILSFHIVSQIGYMLLGLGFFTPVALTASIFYIVHHIIVKTNLFLVSGVAFHLRGTYALKKLGGLYASQPLLAVLFLTPALSLAGVPPLSGFWAKLMLAKVGLELGRYSIVAVALAVGMLTLFSMTKIWSEAFWKGAPERAVAEAPAALSPQGRLWLLAPVVVLALLTLAIGLAPEPLYALAKRAADQLMDPAAYIHAVLGG